MTAKSSTKTTRSTRSKKRALTAIDLFCGSGAVTLALKANGFEVLAAVDNDPVSCQTYRANHPKVELYDRDIQSVAASHVKADVLGSQQLGLLVVCAPCQPFSSQNRYRSDDERAQLILEAGRFIRALRPRLVFFENVPGLASPRNRNLIVALRKKVGPEYTLGEPITVDAADYGVPQRRVRCIMLASRGRPPPPLPKPTTPSNTRMTVADAIQHLRRLGSGEKCPGDDLHYARNHQRIAIERMRRIPKNGGSRFSLPPELELDCHRGHKGHPDVYGRMSWDDVAPTLTTGCDDLTRGRFGHPEDDRAITLREAALLQTFPTSYRFIGNRKQIATQIGNAVPVGLVSALAPTFKAAILGNRRP